MSEEKEDKKLFGENAGRESSAKTVPQLGTLVDMSGLIGSSTIIWPIPLSTAERAKHRGLAGCASFKFHARNVRASRRSAVSASFVRISPTRHCPESGDG